MGNGSMTIKEIAELFDVHTTTVLNWIKQGYIKGAYKSGPAPNSPWRVPAKEIEQLYTELRGEEPA